MKNSIQEKFLILKNRVKVLERYVKKHGITVAETHSKEATEYNVNNILEAIEDIKKDLSI